MVQIPGRRVVTQPVPLYGCRTVGREERSRQAVELDWVGGVCYSRSEWSWASCVFYDATDTRNAEPMPCLCTWHPTSIADLSRHFETAVGKGVVSEMSAEIDQSQDSFVSVSRGSVTALSHLLSRLPSTTTRSAHQDKGKVMIQMLCINISQKCVQWYVNVVYKCSMIRCQ